MATLESIFKLTDRYSKTIRNVEKSTTSATDKILKASKSTDDFNNKLNNTSRSADSASGGIRKLIGAVVSLKAVQKGMSIVDEYTNTKARLDLINDGLQTQAELQDKIFQAASRSRGEYTEMASAVSKMGLLAGDAFVSNDELIGFTELVQKSFKVGGADTSEQMGAMRQLTQAMASGRLQGDELVSIMENAPMIYDAIAKYMDLSKGKLKELSSEGAISADIIKNAMFMAADDINSKFESMPMTFGDYWNQIKNGALEAFTPIMDGISRLINTEEFMAAINFIIGGINILAFVISDLINFVIDNWNIVGPIIIAGMITGVILLTSYLWGMLAPILASAAAWMIANAPMLFAIAIIIYIIQLLGEMGITAEMVFGFIGGLVGVFIGIMANAAIAISNSFISIMGTVETVVHGAINLILKGVNKIIDALNKIPGVEIGNVGELNAHWGGMDLIDYVNLGDAYGKGSSVGKNLFKGVSNRVGDFMKGPDLGPGIDPNSFLVGSPGGAGAGKGLGSAGKPATVKGTGAGGKVEVDISDEDLKYLKDIAERDYINKFSTATLAPNVQISFGDVREEADVEKVAKRITKIMEEEIAILAEGAY